MRDEFLMCLYDVQLACQDVFRCQNEDFYIASSIYNQTDYQSNAPSSLYRSESSFFEQFL